MNMLQSEQKNISSLKKTKCIDIFLVTVMLILQFSFSTKTHVFKNAPTRGKSKDNRFPEVPVLSPYDKHKHKSSPLSLSYKDSSLTNKLRGRNKVYQDFYSKQIGSDNGSHERRLDTICSEGEAMLEVEVKTDYRPSHNYWTLIETESDSIVWSFNEYDIYDKVYYHTKCISNNKEYVFTFF